MRDTHSGFIYVYMKFQYLECEADEKPSQLIDLLVKNGTRKLITYFMMCACVDYWGTVLPHLSVLKDFSLICLHGKLKQAAREKALALFTSLSSGILLCTDVAARGLDIPGVDCIIQEEAYIEFLKLRIVPLEGTKCSAGAPDIIPQIRAAAKRDRDIMEKGPRAFLSYICAYKEHHCSYIFRWKELEIGKLGMGFRLWQLPLMPEVKHYSLPIERDKSREKQRKENVEAKRASKELEQKQEKPKAVSNPYNSCYEEENSQATMCCSVSRGCDELANEYQLPKKLKKGKIDENQYAKLTGTEYLLKIWQSQDITKI